MKADDSPLFPTCWQARNLHIPSSFRSTIWRGMDDKRILRKSFLHTHVTALRIIEPKLLLEGKFLVMLRVNQIASNNSLPPLGSGGFLNVYSLESTLLLDSIDLFRGARIHGIQSCTHKKSIIVYGGRQIAVVNADVKSPNEVRYSAS